MSLIHKKIQDPSQHQIKLQTDTRVLWGFIATQHHAKELSSSLRDRREGLESRNNKMSQKLPKGGAGGGKAPAKGKKGAGGSAGKKVEDDREESLQAVVGLTSLGKSVTMLIAMVYRFWRIHSRRDSVHSHWKYQE
jgi:hypothetical protein